MSIHSGPDWEREFTRRLGAEIMTARQARGWNRSTLATALASTGEKSIRFYEQGRRRCSLYRLLEICDVLDVSAPDLLDRATPQPFSG
ncbi:helix-turn-helix transcriptional regulator [Actinokineospora auranticolor]|uniref:Helix-turn-helix protein n=1 Tax=Actinokineospora auranticolor TaxID=155976 RepID=A0A2S6GDF6_9PSEU|nr:helix-turn-helix transcriptional regulator [Actinokineospora auranticolor]PPK63220.1 helix-turn-helix protein [Actinokineospora auranticolor]